MTSATIYLCVYNVHICKICMFICDSPMAEKAVGQLLTLPQLSAPLLSHTQKQTVGACIAESVAGA
jgi:hypothetical protein